MKISELIIELEKFKEQHGNLRIYYTKNHVADVEIDDLCFYGSNKLLLGNKYLDNYTLRVSDKLELVEKDIITRILEKDHNCTKCKHYTIKDSYCHWHQRTVHKGFEDISPVKYACYSSMDDKLHKLMYYHYLLKKEYDKLEEAYLKEGIKFEGKI